MNPTKTDDTSKKKKKCLNSFIRDIYDKEIKQLSLHKGMPYFLSHGGIHLVTLVILFVISIIMSIYLYNSNVASFNQIVYTFHGDTLKNYKLNYLFLEKDMTRRPDDTYNENDIRLSYGYARDTTNSKYRVIKPVKYGECRPACDLVSIVQYVTKNNYDGIWSQNMNYAKVKNRQQFRKTKYISAHERFYYNISTVKDSIRIFQGVTHAKDHLIEWGKLTPNFSFWLGVIVKRPSELNEKSLIRIKFNEIKSANSSKGIEPPLVIDKILPKPTCSNLNEVVYKGEELKDVINQNGIYISGVDTVKKSAAEKVNLVVTVLLGTIIAFMLDVFIQLILKWRRL